jgi:hypothetical protein
MKTFRMLLFLVSLCAFAGLLFAHDQEHGNLLGDYQNGYVRGYQHGSADVQARMNFDFRDDEYPNSGSGHLTYNTNASCDVRVGYLEGYADGYFRRQPRFEANSNSGYGDNRGGYFGSEVSVVAFTQTGYSGQSQEFRIGQYPHLDGPMNDNIDSITVRGNVRVILFDNGNFGGKRIVLDHDFSDLGDFKGKAASMIVEALSTNR